MSGNKTFSWHAGALSLKFDVDQKGHVLLRSLYSSKTTPREAAPYLRDSALLVVEVKLAGQGGVQGSTTTRMVGTYVSRRLQYVQHEERADDKTRMLDIVMRDPSAGITVTSHFMAYTDLPVIRSTASVRNDSEKTISLQQVSSLVIGGISLP